MVKSAIEHMRAIQMQSLAVEVGYTPLGGETRTIRAVVGRTVFRSTDESGIWTRIETRDFIVGKALIDFEPQVVPAPLLGHPLRGRPSAGGYLRPLHGDAAPDSQSAAFSHSPPRNASGKRNRTRHRTAG